MIFNYFRKRTFARKRKVVFCALTILLLFAGVAPDARSLDDPGADLSPFKCLFETEHFKFHCISNDRWAKYYDNFLEQFLIILNTNFFQIGPKWKTTIYLFADKASMTKALRVRGFNGAVWGRYWRKEDAIYIYEGANLGMIAHEVMHKVDYENFKELEPWAREGIPTFFERIYGYKTQFGPVMYVGHQHPGRLKQIATELPDMTIAKIFEAAETKDPLKESDKMLLSTFLFCEGKLPDYFKLAEHGDHHGYDTLVEAAFKTKLVDLEPRFTKFIQKLIVNREALAKIPRPAFFSSEEKFNDFYLSNREGLVAQPLPSLPQQRLEGDNKKPFVVTTREHDMNTCKTAYELCVAKKYSEALVKCNECLKAFPRNLWALSLKAGLEHILKDDTSALATLEIALDVNPTSQENRLTRGIILSHQKKTLEALKDFERLYRDHPKNAMHNGNLGEELVVLKKYSQAMPYLDFAIAHEKQLGEAYYYRSIALQNLGQSQRAVDDLKTSKKLGYIAGSDTFYDPVSKKYKIVMPAKK